MPLIVTIFIVPAFFDIELKTKESRFILILWLIEAESASALGSSLFLLESGVLGEEPTTARDEAINAAGV